MFAGAINVSMKYSEVEFAEDCGGVKMLTCRDSLKEQVAKLADVEIDRLSQLRLETG